MTAFDILSLTAADLLDAFSIDLRAFRTRLVDLPALGFDTLCGLGVAAGIARIDAELARRDTPTASSGDIFADLCALLPA